MRTVEAPLGLQPSLAQTGPDGSRCSTDWPKANRPANFQDWVCPSRLKRKAVMSHIPDTLHLPNFPASVPSHIVPQGVTERS